MLGQRGGGRWLLLIAVAISALAFVFVACGDDDDGGGASAEEIAAVEQLFTQVFESDATNADFFFEHVTDNLIENVLFSTREDCVANAEECIGEPSPVESVSDTVIDGDTATLTVTSDALTLQVGLVREGDVWKVDSAQALSDEVPEGADAVDVSLTEFAFTFDEATIPADGNLYFRASNDGEQPHELAVAPIPADAEDVLAALESIDEESIVAFKLFIVPGQEVDVAVNAPLEPGRYAMVCFFPDRDDPEGTPHAVKGMIADFTLE